MDEKRRAFLQGSLAAAIGLGSGLIGTTRLESQPAELATRRIPSTGEQIPIVGLGTWTTCNVGNDPERLKECAAVMAAFFKAGGRMIDSSPMYASPQPPIGYGLKKRCYPPVFAAEKVWTSRPGNGPAQIE